MVKGVIKVIKLNSRVKEYKMSWYIHHVNLEAHDVAQTANFFRDIIGPVSYTHLRAHETV